MWRVDRNWLIMVLMPAHRGNVWRALLIFICCSGLVGCAIDPGNSPPHRDVYPEDTPVRVSTADAKGATTPANAYYLSVRERKLCAKRAVQGDIVAARKLAAFYFMHHEGPERTIRDDEKFEYWQRVMARLEEARLEKAASKARRQK
jgi:hypothetical protein